ncbi:MAG: cytochrome c family protein [Parvularculaceae bacterium]
MKDPLFGNKVAAAVLTALLLIFGLPQITKALFGGGHHGGEGEELHLAYGGDLDLGAGHAAEDEGPKVTFEELLANASAAAGERRAAICKSCHTLDKGGANGTGPNLWGIVNRAVGSHEGFNYTAAVRAAGGVWSYDRLDHYLANSPEYIPGTAMAQRIAKPEQRAEIIAYLYTLSDSPAALPEVAAPAAEEAAAPAEEHAEEHMDDAAEAAPTEEASAAEEHAGEDH